MMEWFTLKVMRTLQYRQPRSSMIEPMAHLYSTPSLMVIGFFFVSRSLVVFLRSKTIFLPAGSVGESSSRVRTVTWAMERHRVKMQ